MASRRFSDNSSFALREGPISRPSFSTLLMETGFNYTKAFQLIKQNNITYFLIDLSWHLFSSSLFVNYSFCSSSKGLRRSLAARNGSSATMMEATTSIQATEITQWCDCVSHSVGESSTSIGNITIARL